MTAWDAVVGCVGAIAILVWVLDLVRSGRLYAGYGVAWIVVIVAAFVACALRVARGNEPDQMGVVFTRASGAIGATLAVSFMFVYVLSQLTIVANRVAIVVQELAIERARTGRREDAPEASGPAAESLPSGATPATRHASAL